MALRAYAGFALLVAASACFGSACTCSKRSPSEEVAAATAVDAAGGVDAAAIEPARVAGASFGLSAPIAAVRGEASDVIVAGLDVAARSIRVQRISSNDQVVAERTVFEGIAWSTESDLRLASAAGGVAITWRGIRAGRLVRQLLVLGTDLAPKGEAVDVASASCATHDALWFTDGKRIHRRPWSGNPTRSDLPKDKDAAIVCGAHRAFALLDEDDGTGLVLLGMENDAGAAAQGERPAHGGKGPSVSTVMTLLEESQFGEDEQRERAEYTIGDDFGVVRLAASGALSIREVNGGKLGPLRKLKTKIPSDDDVVAVDASSRFVIVVFSEDAGEACVSGASDGAAGAGGAGTAMRVKALRVDRTTQEESVVELAPGACGREVGPFFTGSRGEAISVAWVERVPTAGKARAPVAGLAHRTVVPVGPLPELARIDQAADALVDAGCDGTRCYAAALARREGADAMIPGFARVLRY